jgi:hypothetical protein
MTTKSSISMATINKIRISISKKQIIHMHQHITKFKRESSISIAILKRNSDRKHNRDSQQQAIKITI